MRKQAAIDHFGSGAAVARQIKNSDGKPLSRAAVSKWGDIVPLRYVWELRQASGGKLAVRLSDYRMRTVE